MAKKKARGDKDYEKNNKMIKCPVCGAKAERKSLKDEYIISLFKNWCFWLVISDPAPVPEIKHASTPFPGIKTVVRHIRNRVFCCPECNHEWAEKR